MKTTSSKLSPIQKDTLCIVANKGQWVAIEKQLKHKIISPITIRSLVNRGYIEFKESDFLVGQYTATQTGYFLTEKGIELFRKGII